MVVLCMTRRIILFYQANENNVNEYYVDQDKVVH